MKQVLLCILLLSFVGSFRASSQATELAQLALNIEKLAQLKKILSNMVDGYRVLTNGYQKVKDITSGNYTLHEVFLDGLYAVSPEVRKYYRIPDIISYQASIVSEAKEVWGIFKGATVFSATYKSYLENIYKNLYQRSSKNLTALITVITAGQTRMSDDERLQEIDRLFGDTDTMLSFLRQFNMETRSHMINKQKALADGEANKALMELN